MIFIFGDIVRPVYEPTLCGKVIDVDPVGITVEYPNGDKFRYPHSQSYIFDFVAELPEEFYE